MTRNYAKRRKLTALLFINIMAVNLADDSPIKIGMDMMEDEFPEIETSQTIKFLKPKVFIKCLFVMMTRSYKPPQID